MLETLGSLTGMEEPGEFFDVSLSLLHAVLAVCLHLCTVHR